MRPPSCVSCGLPVLELRGQFTVLSPYLVVRGVPPPDTAGAWHLPCLEASSVGEQWYQAKQHSYLNVRGYELVARTRGWTVVRNPRTGEVLALGRSGASLALSETSGPGRAVPGGAVHVVTEPSFSLEYDPPVVRDIQDGLRAAGRFPVADVADRLGSGDRLARRDLLDGAALGAAPPCTSPGRWASGRSSRYSKDCRYRSRSRADRPVPRARAGFAGRYG